MYFTGFDCLGCRAAYPPGPGPAAVPGVPPAARGALRSGPLRARGGPRRARAPARRGLALDGAAPRPRPDPHRHAGRGRHPVPPLRAPRPGLRGARALAQVRRGQSHRLAQGPVHHRLRDQGGGVRLRGARVRLHRQQGLVHRGLRRARRARERGVLPEGHPGPQDGAGGVLRGRASSGWTATTRRSTRCTGGSSRAAA